MTFLLLAIGVGADPSAEKFFEKSVRPILAEHCLQCHGDKKQKGGVRLDAAEDVFKVFDGGAVVVVPKDVKRGRLLQAVRHDGENRMPPDGSGWEGANLD